MNVLVISSYPPMPCGIGAYAEQHVGALRREGSVVDVVAPDGGDGDVIADLHGGWKPLRLIKHAWAYDRIYIHYTPSFYYRSDSAANRASTRCAFFLLHLLFGRRTRYFIHETDYKIDSPKAGSAIARIVDGWIWRLTGGVVFHSDAERNAFAQRFGISAANPKFEVVEHGRHFVSRCNHSRTEARRQLGIPEKATLFICIGFVQPHKGFDRVIGAMKHLTNPQALLRIIGSVRIAWQPAIDYAAQLHREAAEDPRCDFIEEFVSPEAFDTWIVASDYVVVPYREIWSSGVGARAVLHGRSVIAADAGGLRDQLPEGTRFFTTDEELAALMKEITDAVPAAADTPQASPQPSAQR